jgi:hypothetical protein
MSGWSSWLVSRSAPGGLPSGKASTRCSALAATVRAALVLGAVGADAARAADSVSIAVRVNVVPVCRFLTAASTIGIMGTDSGGALGPARARPAMGSATLTYSCSNGTAAAFTFAVPAATNVACAECSGIATEVGTILATSFGIGQGMGLGHDRTLTVRTPFVAVSYQETESGANSDTIVVTVSP